MTMHKNQEYETPLIQDIVQAHDVLTMFIIEMEKLGDRGPGKEFMATIYGNRDALCWILGHKGNALELNINTVLDILEKVNKTNLN